MKMVVLLLAAFALSGCDQPNPYTKTARGQEPRVSNDDRDTTYRLNGTIDGCRLYYVDPRYGGRFHLAVCDRTASTAMQESCGKACTRPVIVTTER